MPTLFNLCIFKTFPLNFCIIKKDIFFLEIYFSGYLCKTQNEKLSNQCDLMEVRRKLERVYAC